MQTIYKREKTTLRKISMKFKQFVEIKISFQEPAQEVNRLTFIQKCGTQ